MLAFRRLRGWEWHVLVCDLLGMGMECRANQRSQNRGFKARADETHLTSEDICPNGNNF
jgi:hypothetical protein